MVGNPAFAYIGRKTRVEGSLNGCILLLINAREMPASIGCCGVLGGWSVAGRGHETAEPPTGAETTTDWMLASGVVPGEGRLSVGARFIEDKRQQIAVLAGNGISPFKYSSTTPASWLPPYPKYANQASQTWKSASKKSNMSKLLLVFIHQNLSSTSRTS